MDQELEDKRLRELAVDKHDLEAAAFEDEYGSRSLAGHRSTAFLLGRARIDKLLGDRLVEMPSGSRILDAGCGTGHQVADLISGGFDAVGLEPSVEMRQRARALNSGIEIVDGTITDLPFEDASMDGIIALEVLRYLPRGDVLRAYQEMHRVLRPGGMLFITMVNRWAIDGYALWELVLSARSRRQGGAPRAHCEFVTPREVRRDLVSHGFVEVETSGRLLIPLRWAYKIHRGLGRVTASVLDPVDEVLARLPGTTAFAGHLIVEARRNNHAVG